MFQCEICTATFSRRDNLLRHRGAAHASTMSPCDVCDAIFTRRDNLLRHVKNVHTNSTSTTCPSCGEAFDSMEQLHAHAMDIHHLPGTSTHRPVLKRKRSTREPTHAPRPKARKEDFLMTCDLCDVSVPYSSFHGHLRSNAHKNKACSVHDTNVEVLNSAFQSRIVSYRVRSDEKLQSVTAFAQSVKLIVLRLLEGVLIQHTTFKVNFELFGQYMKFKQDGSELTEVKSFNTKNVIVSAATAFAELFDNFFQLLNTKSEEFQERDSGWALVELLHLEVNANKYSPLRGSSYIDLPPWVKLKKACINVQNGDNACFAWSIMSALHPAKSNVANRTSSYPHYSAELNLNNIDFPMEMPDIRRFEQQNNVSVNVYGIENRSIVGPLYYTTGRKTHHVNLLYIEHSDNAHYCWIKDLSRLAGGQLSKKQNKKWLCDGCLQYFRTEDQLITHSSRDCNHLRTFLPTNNILQFKDYRKQMRVPFTIYCDFEAALRPVNSCLPDPNISSTTVTHIHNPYSFAYYIKCSYDDSLNKLELYRGDNAAAEFKKRLEQDAVRLGNILETNIPMAPLTPVELQAHFSAVTCAICGGPYTDDNRKIFDHDHMTGRYRFAVHNNCNLAYRIPTFVPVILHNLSGYDSHFLVREFGAVDKRLEVLANNKERYISFTNHIELESGGSIALRFLDSFRFMASSLDKLSSNLKDEQFTEIRRYFPEEEQFQLIRRKGVFPYEYVDSTVRLDECALPPQQAFYSTLNASHISDDDYSHAERVWQTFNIKTLGEFSDLYLKTDTLLLTEVFENFRNVCLSTYSLDPCQHYTAPGLSWNAMLRYTQVKLELLTDIDMVHFIKSSIRGGLSQCSGRYAKANNRYMADYNPDVESTYIVFLDYNNLYGYSMIQPLPMGQFRWLSQEEMGVLHINTLDDFAETGYILEVDLEYPKDLQRIHNELPFCCESMPSPYTHTTTPMLIANLNNKCKYVIHYRNLKQCLSHGLKLTKIHRVLQFHQSCWLKPYIELNTTLRTAATNAFEKDFYKLMNNSVFGKTMEDVDKRVDVKLVTRWNNVGKSPGASTLIARPNFHSSAIIHEDLVVIQMNRLKVTYNKPIYVGYTVLELSKTLMYEFHYDYMLKKYPSQVKLLYTDTDSFIYEIKTADFYDDIKTDLDRFDTSDYPPDNIFQLERVNKRVLGKMKDECAGILIDTFVGTKSKSYCIRTVDDATIKKQKGISKTVVRNELHLRDYINCIHDQPSVLRKQMYVFRSRRHQLYTHLITKVALSSDDSKRFVIPNSTDTLAWGHDDIDNSYYFT